MYEDVETIFPLQLQTTQTRKMTTKQQQVWPYYRLIETKTFSLCVYTKKTNIDNDNFQIKFIFCLFVISILLKLN